MGGATFEHPDGWPCDAVDDLDGIFSSLYAELRGVAAGLLRQGERSLQPTLLVHEAYLKLCTAAKLDWRTRTHVRAIAARAMRQVIVDVARRGGRAKRGRGWERVSLQGIGFQPDAVVEAPVAEVNEAIAELTKLDARAGRVVVLRFFGALTDEEIGEALGVTARTVRNDWRMARAWLRTRLAEPARER